MSGINYSPSVNPIFLGALVSEYFYGFVQCPFGDLSDLRIVQGRRRLRAEMRGSTPATVACRNAVGSTSITDQRVKQSLSDTIYLECRSGLHQCKMNDSASLVQIFSSVWQKLIAGSSVVERPERRSFGVMAGSIPCPGCSNRHFEADETSCFASLFR